MIIGMMGLAKSGKTTLANMLCGELEGGYNTLSFAEPIKTALRSKGIVKADSPAEYRIEAQKRGREWRESNPDYFLDELKKFVEDNPGNYIIDDVRYINEVNMIRGMGGAIVFIDASDRIEPDYLRHPYNDPSERLAVKIITELSNPPFFIDLYLMNKKDTTLHSLVSYFSGYYNYCVADVI